MSFRVHGMCAISTAACRQSVPVSGGLGALVATHAAMNTHAPMLFISMMALLLAVSGLSNSPTSSVFYGARGQVRGSHGVSAVKSIPALGTSHAAPGSLPVVSQHTKRALLVLCAQEEASAEKYVNKAGEKVGDVESGAKDSLSDAKSSVSGAASSAKDKASGAAGDAKDKASGIAGDAKDKASGVAGDAKEKAGEAGDSASEASEGAASKVGNAAKSAGGAVADTAKGAGSKVSGAASSAGSAVSGAAGKVGDKASNLAGKASDAVSGDDK